MIDIIQCPNEYLHFPPQMNIIFVNLHSISHQIYTLACQRFSLAHKMDKQYAFDKTMRKCLIIRKFSAKNNCLLFFLEYFLKKKQLWC